MKKLLDGRQEPQNLKEEVRPKRNSSVASGNIPKVKEPVRIRLKKLVGGNKSIYLARFSGGRYEYEFLRLYLKPERTTADRDANAETMRLANAVKAQRIVELQNTAHGFSLCTGRSKVSVVEYIRDFAEKKRQKAGGGKRTTAANYLALARQIEDYSGPKTVFRQIDKRYCESFIEFLRSARNRNNGKSLKENTQFGYMKKFEAVLNSAVSDEIINQNPFRLIKSENKPKLHKTEIVYLPLDEIAKLENTECPSPNVKQAFLFCCFTGLRISDTKGLTWEKLKKDLNGNLFISYITRKTKKYDCLPVSKKAEEFLPDRAGADDADRVFALPGVGYFNLQLKAWAALAGVKVHLTSHVARKSCASNLLTMGERMEVVPKILAHSSIMTTEAAYGVIAKPLQREAMNKFDKFYGLTV